MTPLDFPAGAPLVQQTRSASFRLRLGRRGITVCRDAYVRRYRVNPVIECSAGRDPGHLEILLLRRWLVVLSKRRT